MMHDDPLLEGFGRYQAQYYGDGVGVYDELSNGQSPSTLVIGCCDSRVHPPSLMDTEPGEMFVLRNVANIVPPHDMCNQHASVAAALEFAVLQLKIKRIIVLGHKNCGGIRALLDGSAPADSALGQWLNVALTAKEAAQSMHRKKPELDPYKICEQVAILVSLNNLQTYPWLAERVASNEVQIDGWYFDMQKGELLGYSDDAKGFVTLVEQRNTVLSYDEIRTHAVGAVS